MAEIMETSQTTSLGSSYAAWIEEIRKKVFDSAMDEVVKSVTESFLEEYGVKSVDQAASIFRVPARLQRQSPEHYQPKVVAIGPYHRCNSKLPIEDKRKWGYVGYFLSNRSLNLEKWLRNMNLREQEARNYYSEDVSMDSKSFLEMLLIDSCFILQTFETINYLTVPKDWSSEQIMLDLLMLENQIPFFVLVQLYRYIENPADIISLTFNSFQNSHPMGRYIWNLSAKPDEVLHLLHLFHLFLVQAEEKAIDIDNHQIPTHVPSATVKDEGKAIDIDNHQIPTHIPSATELHDQSAVRFQKINTCEMLNIRFRNGVMEIPTLQIHIDIITQLRNLIAFEQCYSLITPYLTAYATFMGYLINKESDVKLLENSGILLNELPTNKDATIFFSELTPRGKFRNFSRYFSHIILDVDKYHNNKWNRWYADLKLNYFSNPWVTLSVVSAAALLILSFLQAYYAVITYYHS